MQTAQTDIRKFELEVKLADGGKREYDYRRSKSGVVATVKIRDREGKKTKQEDQAGVEAAERLLSEVAPSPQMSEDELLSRSRAALHMSDDAIDELEVEVEFADGTEIEAESGK